MDPTTRQLIEALHRSGGRCVLALTGGGASAVGLLLSVPGGSRTVLEVAIPYHEQALADFLGRRPEQFCSAVTGRDMAVRARERGLWLLPGEAVVGLGATAGLATDRPKRGDHRFHLATATADGTTTHSLTLTKGPRDRASEEAVLAAVLLNALAEAFGLAMRLEVPLLPGEEVVTERQPAGDPLSRFLRGEVPAVCAEPDGRLTLEGPRPAVLLPGAFNPIHEGHHRLAETVARRAGGPAAFELSVVNVDKPPLPGDEVRRRLGQFVWRAPVWLTRAPTFVEKAALFPGAAFAVGADTAARIVSCRYYQDSEERLAAALDAIRRQGCRFLVAGRAGPDGRFLTLADIALPDAHRDLFDAIPEDDFRLDLSSTQLRSRGEPSA